MIKQVGIKELKDRASSIVDEVEKKRKPFIITRNNKPVARIVPIVSDLAIEKGGDSDFFKSANEALKEMGRVSRLPKQEWASLGLKKIPKSVGDFDGDSEAIRAISEDRDER
jgi:prevent-host-death family protein